MPDIDYGPLDDDSRRLCLIAMAKISAIAALQAQQRVAINNFMANHESTLSFLSSERTALEDEIRQLTNAHIVP